MAFNFSDLASKAINSVTGSVTKKLNASDLSNSVAKSVDSLTTSKSGSYNVTHLSYPSEITQNVDMQHYVTFFINVRGKSKFYKDHKDQIVGEISTKGENRLDPKNLSNATTAAGAVTGGVAALKPSMTLGKAAFARVLGNGGSIKKAGAAGILTTAAGVGTGAVVGAAVASIAVKSDTTYRIKDAITLHLSQSPSAHYNAAYDTADLGAVVGFLSGGSSFVDSMQASSMTVEGLIAMGRTAMQPSASLITAGNGKALIEATSKQTLNPYREVLFRSVGFRKFSFEYRFMPKNQKETDAVQNIIQTFKEHMHPELSEGGMYYIHPSEFNIQYYFSGKENKYFNKISTCVLEDMHVDYGGQEGVSSFKDGAPVEIHMRLIFQELETLTRERVQQGY